MNVPFNVCNDSSHTLSESAPELKLCLFRFGEQNYKMAINHGRHDGNNTDNKWIVNLTTARIPQALRYIAADRN